MRHAALRRLCFEAVLLSAAILLPQLFHLAAGPAAGGMLLPMHLPVLLAGLLLGPGYGSLTGVLAPLFSFALTGMPNAAKLPFMLIELTLYGCASGLFSKRMPALFSLLLAMLAGRLAYAGALGLAIFLLRLSLPPLITVWTATLAGIPGILIQLAFLPALVSLLRRYLRIEPVAAIGCRRA